MNLFVSNGKTNQSVLREIRTISLWDYTLIFRRGTGIYMLDSYRACRACRVRDFRGTASADSRRVSYGAARTSTSAIAAAFPLFKRIFKRMPVASTGVTKAKSTC